MNRQEALEAIHFGALQVATHPLFERYCTESAVGRRLLHAYECGDRAQIAATMQDLLTASLRGESPGGEWFHNNRDGRRIADALASFRGVSLRNLYREAANV